MKFNGGKSVQFEPRQLEIKVLGSDNDLKKLAIQQLDKKGDIEDACYDGKFGMFQPIENDFSLIHENYDEDKHFTNRAYWTADECAKVKKFRFIIALLVLCAVTFCMMSRQVLNVGIVEMTKPLTEEELEASGLASSTTETIFEEIKEDDSDDVGGIEIRADESSTYETTTILVEENVKPVRIVLNWTPVMKNYLIASFYVGYAPSMMLGGGLVNKIGAWLPLFVGVFSSFIFNSITPAIAQYSYGLLVASRVTFGILQGSIMPAAYDIFNCWLTMNEASIIVPMIKVFFAVGCLLGSGLPGITKVLGYDWTFVFYECSVLCFLWSILWYLLASSTPQTNRWVDTNELHRITRKKKPPTTVLATVANGNDQSAIKMDQLNNGKTAPANNRDPAVQDGVPWLQIVFNRSVLALALTKFTYTVGIDFIALESSIYLNKVHEAPTETISLIGSIGSIIQLTCITFVGWSALYVVQNNVCGLSKTKWRKIYQGLSNFGMAGVYLIMATADPSFDMIVILLLLVYTFWMLGSGGESLVPYDLSIKYPATVFGISHSLGVLSSVVVPLVSDLILNGDDTSKENWNFILLLISGACFVGGLAFVFILRPKPFLPGECEPKSKASQN